VATYKDASSAVKEYGLNLLLNSPGVHAVGVGTKSRVPIAVSKPNDFCVTAVVSERKAVERLERENIRPFARVFGKEVKGTRFESVETNVIESGGPFSLQFLRVPRIQRGIHGGRRPVVDVQKFFNSLRCGIGISNPSGLYPAILSVGTLGAFVRDTTEVLYLLSNNHVIGHSDAAKPGDSIVQTGTLDLTEIELTLMPTESELVNALKIAELTTMVPIQRLSPSNIPLNKVDAAIAKLVIGSRSLTDLARLCYAGGILALSRPIEADDRGVPTAPARVYKVGRTTGFTEGEIELVGVIDSLDYPGGKAYFQDQIQIRPTVDNGGPFSLPGDSGSIVLSDHHEAIGLLFAGSPRQTLVNPMQLVLDELSKKLGKPLELVTL